MASRSLVFVDPADVEPGSVVGVSVLWTPGPGSAGWSSWEQVPDPPLDGLGWWAVGSTMGAAWGDHHPSVLSKIVLGVADLFQEVPEALSVSVLGINWAIPYGLAHTVAVWVPAAADASEGALGGSELDAPGWLVPLGAPTPPELPSGPGVLLMASLGLPRAVHDMLPDALARFNEQVILSSPEASMECDAVSEMGRPCVLVGAHPTHRSEWPIEFWENLEWRQPARRGVSRLEALVDRLTSNDPEWAPSPDREG